MHVDSSSDPTLQSGGVYDHSGSCWASDHLHAQRGLAGPLQVTYCVQFKCLFSLSVNTLGNTYLSVCVCVFTHLCVLRQFFKSPNFDGWFRAKHKDMTDKVECLHLEAICAAVSTEAKPRQNVKLWSIPTSLTLCKVM